MANIYVYHAAAGSGTGADWTNAYTTLAAAFTAKAAGDVFFVASDHAETQASAMTCTSPGTEANPCRVYCVSRSGSVPPVPDDLDDTATITTTGTSNMTLAGSVSECYGIRFTCGTGGSATNLTVASTAGRSWRVVNCKFRVVPAVNTSRIIFGGPGSFVVAENCTIQVHHTGSGIRPSGRFIWRNTSGAIVLGSTPSTLLLGSGDFGQTLIEGVDLSNVTNTLSLTVNVSGTLVLKDCKYNASTLTGLSNSMGGMNVILLRSDNGDTNYRTERMNYAGTQTTETTIVRSGGASDGTTPIAWKIVTTANAEKDMPYESLPIEIWNETLSSITVTIEGIWGGGSVPNNDDIWINVQYLGVSGVPRSVKATSGKADALATGTGYSSGSGSWGGSTTQFAMAVTITPEEKGPITIYVCAGAVSSTFYIDPFPVIT